MIKEGDLISVYNIPHYRKGGIYQAATQSYFKGGVGILGCLLRDTHTGLLVHMQGFGFRFVREPLKLRSM